MKESNKNTREESKKEERNEREQQNISQSNKMAKSTYLSLIILNID